MIKLLTIHEVKKQGTRSVWVEKSRKESTVDRTQYNNIFDSVKFFRNLGGTETITKAYTCSGYIPNRLVSTSPDKRSRTIRNFTFEGEC